MELTPYAETPALRLRQQLQDAATPGWTTAWLFAGRALYRTIEHLRSATGEAESAGASAGDTVHTLALWSGLLVALMPIVWLLARYLPGRLRWMREAGAAAGLRIDADDLHLFALRAVANAPLYVLRRATPDPAAALAQGDDAALAGIELERLGLRAGPR